MRHASGAIRELGEKISSRIAGSTRRLQRRIRISAAAEQMTDDERATSTICSSGERS
jgi:hypothetical protein